ncbi:hypothetical protein ACH5RR_041655 [Cinchona calisaya]|uniref:DUF7870 domain-containing protein n=1 Tax=Cinchona calisaya TaxID=153742 RepID=A0ABD2XVD8_9GENT
MKNSLRNLQCKSLSCGGIFVILLFTLITKTKDSISSFSKLNIYQAYTDHLEAVHYYYAVFQRLSQEGYLSPTSKSLCTKDQDSIALKRIGISDVFVISGHQDFDRSGDNTFDFEFLSETTVKHVLSNQPVQTAFQVCRTLRYRGYLAVHIEIKDEYSFNSFINLFPCCKLVASRYIRSLNSSHHSVRELVLRKNSKDSISNNGLERCSKETVPKYKWDLIRNLEELEEKEPAGDWTERAKYKESIKLFKYLPSLVDLSFKKRYIYIDLGARTYDSTIGNWFKKLYPKQNKGFEIYAIEADKNFHEEYKKKKDVILLPYAAWIRNQTLVFGTRNKRREYTGKVQSDKSEIMQDYKGEQNVVQAFDFADWLIRSFSKQDFVVLKMDVEGTEMDLIPRLVETGAICLIDELFVECHYDRWVKCCSGPGHLEPMLPERLHKRPLSEIAKQISLTEFNCVRLTYATHTLTRLANLTLEQNFYKLGLNEVIVGTAKNNPDILGITVVEAQRAVIVELSSHGVMVLLDNHVSHPMWCCGNDDGNRFFGDKYFDPIEWLRGLAIVSTMYKDTSMPENDLDWAVWSLQGSYYIKEGVHDPEETYAMLNYNWSTIRSPEFHSKLQLIQKKIQDPTSKEENYLIMYHALRGKCARVDNNKEVHASECWEPSKWIHEGEGTPIRLKNTNLCLKAIGDGLPVALTNDCISQQSNWKLALNSLHKLASQGEKRDRIVLGMESLLFSKSADKQMYCFRE